MPGSSNSQQNPFHSYPQKFPKSQVQAKAAAAALLRLVQHGPRSQPAQIVDTSFHLSQGYVTCTTNSVVVQVYAVPYGSVVNGMRIFVRQIGSHVTNKAFIFDGFAPNLSGLGQNGSLLLAQPALTSTAMAPALTSTGGMTSITGVNSSQGYFWYLFFYLPALPTSVVTLFQMSQAIGSNTLNLEYLPTGFLQFRSNDGYGYITTGVVSPHNMHFVLIQPGITDLEFQVDSAANYTGLLSPTDEPTFLGGGQTYTGSYLSTLMGTQACPLGTWVSKMGYGVSYESGTIIPLALTNNDVIPTQDSDLPMFQVTQTQKTLTTYLCEDAQGSSTLANSSASWGSSAPNSTLNLSPQAQVQVPGPY